MRPDTPADHTTEAERLLRTAAQYPEDREPLVLQAAAHLELAGDRARASTLYDDLLAAPEAGAENPHLIKALKAANLWEYGHEAEARAIIDGIRAAGPLSAAPWQIAAETLEAHDELESAHDFFSTALTLLLAPGEEVPYATQSLLTGRHRVRRLMGLDHDAWDELAGVLHTAPVPLDELHDPKRLWSLGSSDPAELQAEIARLRAELGTYRTALSRPFPVAVLHWPADELRELLTAYPELTEEYVDHATHLNHVEAALRDLHAAGAPNLGIVTGTVPSYEAFAASEATPPATPDLLPQYATTLAARGRATPWPPSRTATCWCGSGETYGGCHGAE
ncbi:MULTISPECIES: SEC-C domain-containing protein [Streptomyces]|uniref:Preprotein translocase subunit SecA n=2 Tax=Streptomyces TaxID=1883 RepID=A0A1V0UA06_STRVN|nr:MULTISPECIES: SEC-C domain-containing protein [Streptomyces]NEA10772.1 SEC-C domain-containing protein [Streptomyces sp. SID10692]ARF61937.1 preprotein translocase subunit SecA [Streptomyces violaceoruber]QRV27884.1 SEC-C domain-containing protein [Streptomyces californicus]QRV36451.1 SEC-C domain-containing protein [Streptomyces californicus]QRV41283.1 SEC-C domain-containing protein [Streptomyces californicus]